MMVEMYSKIVCPFKIRIKIGEIIMYNKISNIIDIAYFLFCNNRPTNSR